MIRDARRATRRSLSTRTADANALAYAKRLAAGQARLDEGGGSGSGEGGGTGAGGEGATGGGGGTGGATDEPPDDPPLGPAGEKALEAWKDRAKKAEKAQKDLEARLEKVEEAQKSEHEKALDAARQEAAKAARAELEPTTQSLQLENAVLRAAQGKFADVEDAVIYLKDKQSDLLGDDGVVDPKALDSAITKLLEDKPHLAATASGNGGRPPRPNQGPNGGSQGAGVTFDTAWQAAAERAGVVTQQEQK